jgi:hypothetical protein
MMWDMVNKWVFVILIVTGCKSKISLNEYGDYLNNPRNKITQKIEIGGVEASMKWIPSDYYRLMRKRDKESEDSLAEDDYYYFNAKFEKTEGEKPEKNKILYLDFDMQKDFVLLMGKDSVMPGICQKVENGIAGSYEYMLAFEKGERHEEDNGFTVIYNDKIFGIGTIAFVYNRDDIKRIPKLKVKTQDEVSYKPE